jgi:pimeloyl-ACP methyl ester carboxylesterase
VNPGPTTRTVIVDGASVTCAVAGVDREDVDPVLLLPGLGGSTDRDFSFLLPLLARTHRVVAVDLQYGPSMDLDRMAGQLAGVIGQLLPRRRVTLVGFSVGASVAAAYAAGNSDVAGLVLVAAVLRATARHRLLAALRQELDPGESVRALDVVVAHSPAFLESRGPEQLAALRPFGSDSHTAVQAGLFARTDLVGRVPRIGAPTLVVGCSGDDLAGVDQARALFAALPNSRYAEIDSGHGVLAERPAEVLALLRDFASNPMRHRSGSVLDEARP